jgi:transposase
MAVVQLRHDTEGRAYYRRKVAAGKTNMEAMRALKRRLSDVVYRRMVDDVKATRMGPGGQAELHLMRAGAARQGQACGRRPRPTLWYGWH